MTFPIDIRRTSENPRPEIQLATETAMTVRMIMILLYGAGGVPGRGEIPTHRFHKLSEEAGLRRITVHGLRHSHVSLLISKKYDIFEVSKRIGHKSIKTTQDIYGHLFDEVQKTIANDLDSLRRR